MIVFDTTRTKAEAMKKAKKLLAKMKTAGWKIWVSKNENRDVTIWHYRLLNGGLCVSPRRFDGKLAYAVLLGVIPGSDCGIWSEYPTQSYAIDPNRAVEYVVNHAREAFTEYVETLEAAEAVMKTTRRKPARRKK